MRTTVRVMGEDSAVIRQVTLPGVISQEMFLRSPDKSWRNSCCPKHVLKKQCITRLISTVRYSVVSFQKASNSRSNELWRRQVEPPSQLCLYNDFRPDKLLVVRIRPP